MASCTSYTLSGLNAGCKDSIGGVAKVWLADFDSISWTVATDPSTNEKTTITPDSTSAFKVFKLRRGAASMTSNLQVNDNNSYVQTDLSMNFAKMETPKRLEVMAILMGQTCGIVKDNNGHYWALGNDKPLEATAGTGETGTATSDANQYTVTIQDESAELPFEVVDATTIAALEAITVA
jgi:hypothetical protein